MRPSMADEAARLRSVEKMRAYDDAPPAVRAIDRVFGDTGVAWQIYATGVRSEAEAETTFHRMVEDMRRG